MKKEKNRKKKKEKKLKLKLNKRFFTKLIVWYVIYLL